MSWSGLRLVEMQGWPRRGPKAMLSYTGGGAGRGGFAVRGEARAVPGGGQEARTEVVRRLELR